MRAVGRFRDKWPERQNFESWPVQRGAGGDEPVVIGLLHCRCVSADEVNSVAKPVSASRARRQDGSKAA